MNEKEFDKLIFEQDGKTIFPLHDNATPTNQLEFVVLPDWFIYDYRQLKTGQEQADLVWEVMENNKPSADGKSYSIFGLARDDDNDYFVYKYIDVQSIWESLFS